MDEKEFKFNVENYCPKDILGEDYEDYNSCGERGNKKDSCVECWKSALESKYKKQ